MHSSSDGTASDALQLRPVAIHFVMYGYATQAQLQLQLHFCTACGPSAGSGMKPDALPVWPGAFTTTFETFCIPTLAFNWAYWKKENRDLCPKPPLK